MNTPPLMFDPGLDETPSPARMYDYFLGGHHNFPADRAAAEQVIALAPDAPLVAQANRAFLRRAVNVLAARGVAQFLDLGSGIPTVGNVHDIAQQANPDARVVYVDIDPVAVTHSAALLVDTPTATVIQADARRPEQILAHAETRRLLDLRQPVAVLLVAMLHFVPDDADAERMVRALRDALAPGSYIVISHAISDALDTTAPDEALEGSQDVYDRSTNPFKLRSRAQVSQFFTGLELIEPGLVDTPLWRPEEQDDLFLHEPARAFSVVGVGRKR